MSVDENIFIGPYMRVWPPKETFETNILCCSSAECPRYAQPQHATAHFCPQCGSPITNTAFPQERLIDLYELFRTKLGNGDLFARITETPEEGMVIVLPNLGGQGGIHHLDTIETPFQDYMGCFDHPDWERVAAVFDEMKIRYEKCQGILQWYN